MNDVAELLEHIARKGKASLRAEMAIGLARRRAQGIPDPRARAFVDECEAALDELRAEIRGGR